MDKIIYQYFKSIEDFLQSESKWHLDNQEEIHEANTSENLKQIRTTWEKVRDYNEKLLNDLKLMNAPKECNRFHELINEVFEHRKQSSEAQMRDDYPMGLGKYRRSFKLLIDAMEEKKKIFIDLKAALEEIDNLEQELMMAEGELNQFNYNLPF